MIDSNPVSVDVEVLLAGEGQTYQIDGNTITTNDEGISITTNSDTYWQVTSRNDGFQESAHTRMIRRSLLVQENLP
jgi:flagellar basal body rod protein FlgB